MDFLEEIYTSAPELLEGGAAGSLGVVAKSRDFPRDIEADLGWQRAYSILEDLPLNDPAAHPPRLLLQRLGRQKEFLSITQVVFAGADHTGRTSPLAHHLLFDSRAMEREGLSTAAVLGMTEKLFYRQWRRGPEWLATRTLASTPTSRKITESWARLLSPDHLPPVLASAAQALLLFDAQHRSVLLGLPREACHDIHALMAELLALLPPRIQILRGCFSHVVDDSDIPRDPALIFAYPDTPFFQRHAARRDASAPVVWDITRLSAPAATITGEFGIRLASCLLRDDAVQHVQSLHAEWDALGLQSSQAEMFGLLLNLRDRLQAVAADSVLAPMAEDVAALSAESPPSATRIAHWCRDMLDHRVMLLAPDSRWAAIAEICEDPRWPNVVRQAAIHAIETHAAEALPVIIRIFVSTPERGANIVTDLSRIVTQQPSAVAQALAQACTSGTAQDVAVAVRLIGLTRSNSASLINTWNEISRTAAADVRSTFVDIFYQRMKNQPPNIADFRELQKSCIHDNQPDACFVAHCFLPLSRDLLARGGTPQSWQQIASDSVMRALAIHQAPEHLRHLAQRYRPRLTAELLRGWADNVSRTMFNQVEEFQDAIAAADLQAVLTPRPSALPLRIGVDLDPGPSRPVSSRRADSCPQTSRRWALLLLVSVVLSLLLLLFGGGILFFRIDNGVIPVSREAVLGICFGGPLLFLLSKIIQVLWLRSSKRIISVAILNVLILFVLIGSIVVVTWWGCNKLPAEWTDWITKASSHESQTQPSSRPDSNGP